jgi:hypothetical protein
MNCEVFKVRIAEIIVEVESIVKIILIRRLSYPVICRKLTEQKLKGLGVCHDTK